MLQAEQQESMVVLQAGAVEVCYGAASKAARCWFMLQAGAATVEPGSSTVQASGDDSGSSVELGLSIGR